MAEDAEANVPTRCGFAAVIGAPNAGKSTLVNRLVGSKVSIVTHKAQTTRARVRGIAMIGQSQVVFVDTPGIFDPRRALDEAMVDAAWRGAAEADLVLFLSDARKGLDGSAARIVAGLKDAGASPVLVLNKIDLLKHEALLATVKAFNEAMEFRCTFLVSATTGDGVDDLASYVADAMPPGPWLYPEDQIADLPMRLLAAEITREQIFLRLHDELPYESSVETEQWEDRKDGSVRIQQVIFVARESQRRIVLGEGGRTIKAIGQAARLEIGEVVGKPVHLFLFVKVRENWASDPERLAMMGLEPARRK